MNIVVETSSYDAHAGTLTCDAGRFPCTLGKAGVIAAANKREGDKKTPLGTYPFRYVLWREDRLPQPETGLSIQPLLPDTGWCEDSTHADYNQQIKLPHDSVVDKMTRDDYLYDIVAVIGYNDEPAVPEMGSAIFMHIAREEGTGTLGCIGLKRDDLLAVLKTLTHDSTITILPPPQS